MNLKRKSWLLFILAFVVFVGVNEDSYAKAKKKKAKVQVEEYEEYGDVGVIAGTPKFKADTEKELKWAKDKSRTEILERAKQKLARGDKEVRIFLINGVTVEEAMNLQFDINKYIQWGEMEHIRKNGETVMFYYYERRMY